MTLIERLRDFADCYTTNDLHDSLVREAANEIERLQKMVEHYEQALKIAFPDGAFGDAWYHWNEARKLK